MSAEARSTLPTPGLFSTFWVLASEIRVEWKMKSDVNKTFMSKHGRSCLIPATVQVGHLRLPSDQQSDKRIGEILGSLIKDQMQNRLKYIIKIVWEK